MSTKTHRAQFRRPAAAVRCAGRALPARTRCRRCCDDWRLLDNVKKIRTTAAAPCEIHNYLLAAFSKPSKQPFGLWLTPSLGCACRCVRDMWPMCMLGARLTRFDMYAAVEFVTGSDPNSTNSTCMQHAPETQRLAQAQTLKSAAVSGPAWQAHPLWPACAATYLADARAGARCQSHDGEHDLDQDAQQRSRVLVSRVCLRCSLSQLRVLSRC